MWTAIKELICSFWYIITSIFCTRTHAFCIYFVSSDKNIDQRDHKLLCFFTELLLILCILQSNILKHLDIYQPHDSERCFLGEKTCLLQLHARAACFSLMRSVMRTIKRAEWYFQVIHYIWATFSPLFRQLDVLTTPTDANLPWKRARKAQHAHIERAPSLFLFIRCVMHRAKKSCEMWTSLPVSEKSKHVNGAYF